MIGGSFLNKHEWKAVVKHKVQNLEESQWRQGLLSKKCYRFCNVHPLLEPNLCHVIAKKSVFLRFKLLNLVKLLAYPEYIDPVICHLCNDTLSDVVEHFILRCSYFIQIRQDMWDYLLNNIDIKYESDIFNRPDNDILELLLGKKWNKIENVQEQYEFIKRSAESLWNILQI